jgi:hypothetical protein
MKVMKPERWITVSLAQIEPLEVSVTNFLITSGFVVNKYIDNGLSPFLINSMASCTEFIERIGKTGPKISSFSKN